MSKTHLKNAGLNPIGRGFQILQKEEAEEVLKLAKQQTKPAKFLKKQLA